MLYISKILRTFAKNFKDMNSKKKIILFVRCSTQQQDVSSQISSLQGFARSLNYTDSSRYHVIGGVAASAVKINDLYLSYLNEMKNMILRGEVECVLTWALNRLFRNEIIGLTLRDFFIEHKIQLFVREPNLKLLTDNGDIDTSMSIAFSIFLTMSSLEAKEIAEKTKRGREYLKSQNKFYGGKLPFGYTTDKNKNVILDIEKAKIVKEIFTMYSTGKYSTNTLKEDFICRGYELKSKIVNRILVNEQYYNNKFGLNIIDKELFDKCAEVRKNNFNTSKKTYKYKTLLNRLIKCKCGYGYSAVHYNAYTCSDKIKHKSKYTEHSITLPLSLFEGMIVDICQVQSKLHYLQDLEAFRKETENKINIIDLKINNLELKLNNYNSKKDKIVELYINGDINKDTYTKKLNTLDLSNDNLINELELLKHEKSQLNELIVAKNRIRVINSEDDFYLVIKENIKVIYVGDLVDGYSIITIHFINGDIAKLKYSPLDKRFTDLNNNILEFSKRVLNTEKILFKAATDGIGKDNAFEYCYLLGKENMVKKIMENKKGGK